MATEALSFRKTINTAFSTLAQGVSACFLVVRLSHNISLFRRFQRVALFARCARLLFDVPLFIPCDASVTSMTPVPLTASGEEFGSAHRSHPVRGPANTGKRTFSFHLHHSTIPYFPHKEQAIPHSQEIRQTQHLSLSSKLEKMEWSKIRSGPQDRDGNSVSVV